MIQDYNIWKIIIIVVFLIAAYLLYREWRGRRREAEHISIQRNSQNDDLEMAENDGRGLEERLLEFNEEEKHEIDPNDDRNMAILKFGGGKANLAIKPEVKNFQFTITLEMKEVQRFESVKLFDYDKYFIRSESNIDFSAITNKNDVYNLINLASDVGCKELILIGIDFSKDAEGFRSIFKHTIGSDIVKLKFDGWKIPKIKRFDLKMELKKDKERQLYSLSIINCNLDSDHVESIKKICEPFGRLGRDKTLTNLDLSQNYLSAEDCNDIHESLGFIPLRVILKNRKKKEFEK